MESSFAKARPNSLLTTLWPNCLSVALRPNGLSTVLRLNGLSNSVHFVNKTSWKEFE
ncbi:hypothetical protein Fmac_025181 [Flemingia macrophylla]|uniref:Uncharacterized protein n=1 Tax=Flemingia macrophylla TaxID=520843 RepID=A0ABD1LRL2_9FABA